MKLQTPVTVTPLPVGISYGEPLAVLGRCFADMRDEERALFTHAFLHECLAPVDPKVFIPRLTENENIVNLLEFLYADMPRADVTD